ncbi:YEATS-associated helix-containing protein [Reinekea thalattae]|uniref:YEATS-Like-Associating Three TM domain-containing protein n=1 Tax=Reinekea thalattae TaxID=2593301 RepID=A0A5C8Z591_9GAMM|nr:YEATS-associated helix-containing protein [Reinekea thalattae]TXR53285.1 hypothetical protein FME95_01555 [Reinekea thalattae]
MANHIFILVAIMLMAGVFGGLLNYYMQAQVDTDNTSMPRCLVGGLAASFLVPLILFLLSSDLIVRSQGDASGLLIFAGFCLIAAWSSRFFLTTITKQIVQEVKTTTQQSNEILTELRLLQREMEPMLDTEIEHEDSGEQLVLAPEDELDVTTANVLTALGNGRYIFRSETGLATEIGLDANTIHKTLNIIVARDLGGKVLTKKGTRWFITSKGRHYLSVSN